MKYLLFVLLPLIMIVAFTGCKKVNYEKDLYFEATIDGDRLLLKQSLDKYDIGLGQRYSSYCKNSYPDGTFDELSYSDAFMRDISKKNKGESAGFTYVHFFEGEINYLNTSRALETLSTGQNVFGKRCNDDTNDLGASHKDKDGFLIIYYDENGKEWATDKGSGIQTGSKIEVVEIVENPDYDGNSGSVITRIDFNAILYDDLGNSKTFTDGHLRLISF